MSDPEIDRLFSALDRVIAEQGFTQVKVEATVAQYLGKVLTKSPIAAQVAHVDVALRAIWATWAATAIRDHGLDVVLALVESFRGVEGRDPGASPSLSPQPATGSRITRPLS